jgi:hypothetical protein
MKELWVLMVPLLYWQGGIESAPALKSAGIERLCVPPDQAEAWRKAGFSPVPTSLAELESREKLLAPGIAGRAEVASPTRSPWVNANGWRFLRNAAGKYYYHDLPKGRAALAVAEAFAYGADAILKIDPDDLAEAGAMLAFLGSLPPGSRSQIADLAVVDDGSPLTGEVMNLLARRNLLFRAVPAPSPEFRLNIRLGTKEYPEEEAANPSEFALKIRRQLGDEHRSLRLYGSEVVLCSLTGEAARLRLHLLNYGRRDLAGLRVRLRGSYAKGEAASSGAGRVELEDHAVANGATEFSIPKLGTYTVVDLSTSK